MQTLLTQSPWLVIIAAVLLGMLIMWLLEMFVLRRTIKSHVTGLEDTLKQRDTDLQTAQTSLSQTNASLKSTTDDLATAQTARADAEKQVATLKSESAKTTADLEAARQAQQQSEAALNARTAEANEQRTKIAALIAAGNDLHAQVTTLTGERDQLRAQNTKLESDLADSQAHQRGAVAEVAKLTATAMVTAAVVKGLESSKSELGSQVATLNDELNKARTESENLNGSLEQANTARTELETQLAETKQQASDLEATKQTLLAQVTELEGKNSALDADVAKLTAGALAAGVWIKQLEGEKATLTEEHSHLQGEFESLQRTKALDDAELNELKVQHSQVNEALGITTREKESYQETLTARIGELGAAQSQLATAKQDNSELLGDVAKFTARAAAAAASVQRLEETNRDLSARVEKLRGDLETERAARTNEISADKAQEPAAAESPSAAQDPNSDPAAAAMPTGDSAASPAATAENPTPNAQTLAAVTSNGEHGADELRYEAACPQDLSEVHGVGAEFEERLYNAGIGTYWDLSQRNEDDLAQILKLDPARRMAVNLAAIRGDALRLARETKSQKRTWSGTAPDDFDMLVGIGGVYEKRLYEAGICTYEALAKSNPEQLAAVCNAPNFNQNHYQSWIDQAHVLMEARRKGM